MGKTLQHLIRSELFLPEELLRFPRPVISLRHRCSSRASWKTYSHSGCKLDNTCREREWSEWVMHKSAGLPYNTALKDLSSDTRALNTITINCGQWYAQTYAYMHALSMNVITALIQSDCLNQTLQCESKSSPVIVSSSSFWKQSQSKTHGKYSGTFVLLFKKVQETSIAAPPAQSNRSRYYRSSVGDLCWTNIRFQWPFHQLLNMCYQ